jgi:DNA-3-methyladenine glycosylase
VLEVAPELLGCLVEHRSADGLVRVRLTEVEAYDGERDPGSHAFRGPTKRNAVMFGEPAHVYVYFTYGMHWCMNLVCGPARTASAVLLRAGEVVAGTELARTRRTSASSPRDLARGPARLTVALGIDGRHNGTDALDVESPIRVLAGVPAPAAVRSGPRVGVAGAGAHHPWRFWLDGEPTVSAYRPAISRRRGSDSSGKVDPAADGEPAAASARSAESSTAKKGPAGHDLR